MQVVTAIVMAYAIALILISPAVPSPLTTLRSKQTVQPPQVVAPVPALLFTSAAEAVSTSLWMTSEPVHLTLSGSERVDLTQARLC